MSVVQEPVWVARLAAKGENYLFEPVRVDKVRVDASVLVVSNEVRMSISLGEGEAFSSEIIRMGHHPKGAKRTEIIRFRYVFNLSYGLLFISDEELSEYDRLLVKCPAISLAPSSFLILRRFTSVRKLEHVTEEKDFAYWDADGWIAERGKVGEIISFHGNMDIPGFQSPCVCRNLASLDVRIQTSLWNAARRK